MFDPPCIPFVLGQGDELGELPQSAEHRAFALEDLKKGCFLGIYQEVSRSHAERAIRKGRIISSAFTVWQDQGAGRKGRFVVNLGK